MGIPSSLSTSVLFYLEQERARGSTIGLSRSEAWPGHCIMYLTKTLYFYTASLLAGIFIVTEVL